MKYFLCLFLSFPFLTYGTLKVVKHDESTGIYLLKFLDSSSFDHFSPSSKMDLVGKDSVLVFVLKAKQEIKTIAVRSEGRDLILGEEFDNIIIHQVREKIGEKKKPTSEELLLEDAYKELNPYPLFGVAFLTGFSETETLLPTPAYGLSFSVRALSLMDVGLDLRYWRKTFYTTSKVPATSIAAAYTAYIDGNFKEYSAIPWIRYRILKSAVTPYVGLGLSGSKVKGESRIRGSSVTIPSLNKNVFGVNPFLGVNYSFKRNYEVKLHGEYQFIKKAYMFNTVYALVGMGYRFP